VWAEQEKCKEKVNWNEFECTNGEKALVLYCRCATLSTNRSQFKANMFSQHFLGKRSFKLLQKLCI
jgi:hypothetical protein